MKARNIILFVAAAQLLADAVTATDAIAEVNTALRTVAAVLAVLMFSIQGLKWVTSETPADRAEAKKGLLYVIIGLLIVYLAANIVCGLYGSAVSTYNINCSFTAADFKCTCTST